MNLQRIKSTNGKDEYVLLKKQIDKVLDEDYVNFELEDFVQNPIALARILAGLTQEELAERLEISQAYISKIENQSKVPVKLMQEIKIILKN